MALGKNNLAPVELKRSSTGRWQVSTFLASNDEVSTIVGLCCLIVLFALFFVFVSPGFFSPYNLFTLGRTIALNMVLGLAMMVVIVTGGLDLSIGAIGVASAMLAGYAMQQLGAPMPLGLVVAVALGTAIGCANGAAITLLGVHSFIVTLASMSIVFGTTIILTKADSFRDLPESFSVLARIRWFGVVSPLLAVSLAAGVILSIIFKMTVFGREILAVGANARSARISGVRVGNKIVIVHAMAGFLAALAGIMASMRNGAAVVSMAGNLGQDWLLPAFMAPVLGGVLLTGGRASVAGTILAACLTTMLTSGLLLMSIGEFWVQFALGAVLLLAVMLERLRTSLVGG